METYLKFSFWSYASIVLFYLIAGINHFINPEWYYPLIPDYLGYPKTLNTIAGIAEILGATGLIFKKTKQLASIGLILMLIIFIPSHWYFIEQGSCIEGTLCVAPWIAWVRLIIIHPLLIAWVWWAKKTSYGIS